MTQQGLRGAILPRTRKLSLAALCGSLLILVETDLEAAGAEPKRVLLIHSFGRDFEPYQTFSGVLRTELASRMPETLDFFEASLGSARFTDSSQEGPLVDYLVAEVAENREDLVVAIGRPAAQARQRKSQNRLATMMFP